MDRCSRCGQLNLVARKQPITLEVGERSFEGYVTAWSCSDCGEVTHDRCDLELFQQNAAKWLAEHGFRTAEELKFMRKSAGIRAADLAAWLGVAPEAIALWEAGKGSPDVVIGSTIAAIVWETLRGESATRERLRIQGQPEPMRKVRIARDAA